MSNAAKNVDSLAT